MDASPLVVAATYEGRDCVLAITGDLDLTTTAALIPALAQAAGDLNGQTDHVVLDLAGLTHLDVGGARALITAVHSMSNGHPVTVRSISTVANRLLSLLDWSLETPAPAD